MHGCFGFVCKLLSSRDPSDTYAELIMVAQTASSSGRHAMLSYRQTNTLSSSPQPHLCTIRTLHSSITNLLPQSH